MNRILYLFSGKESDKKKMPAYFASLQKEMDDISRTDTRIEVRGLSDRVPDQSEMVYWYSHSVVVEEMIEQARKAEKEGFDAAIIGCFGNVEAEYALKEVLDIPVVGVTEAGFLLACALATRFSMVAYNRKVVPWLERTIREYSLEDRLCSIRTIDVELEKVLARRAAKQIEKRMLEEASKAIWEDRAEAVILASAGMVGEAEHIGKKLNVPVIDPVEASIKFAEMLVDLKKKRNLYHSKIACWRPSPRLKNS